MRNKTKFTLYNSDSSYNKLDNLWQALHQSYNIAQGRPINFQLLNKILSHQQTE